MAALVWFAACPAYGQLTVTVTDISPNTSSLDPTCANGCSNGASGGRVNGLAVDRTNPARVYGASEWGGLFRSVDGGVRWAHLDGHVPQATWDVEVDPTNSNRVYATSFYDGRTNSRSGINVSNDGGQTWTHPATARPPANFCLTASNRDEPAAFGISIDPANANRVFIGTNCGLAMSTDAGVTWTFIDPTPNNLARDVWDVVVHDGGIIDICGDDGHQRSTNSGVTWTTATGIPLGSGRCSIAVSPGEPYVIFAVSGNSLFESEDGGANWPAVATYTNTTAQGRIPFVVTNRRQGATYDLWFGDRNLFRRTCTTPSPANPGGAPRCAPATAWTNVDSDAHDDVGDVAFAPGTLDACPILFSSDGGIYRNTTTGSPACHSPNWDQPTVTTHALFVIAFAGSPRAGAQPEDLYLGLQDNGNFGTTNAGAAAVTWTNEQCCDSGNVAAEAARAVTTICCGPGTTLFRSAAGLGSPVAIAGPPGGLGGFQHLSTLLNFGVNQYIVRTTSGVFVTQNIGAATITWTQLGAATTPAAACGLQMAVSGGTSTIFAKSGGCNGDTPGTLWRHQGTAAGGTWTQVPNAGAVGGFGVFGVDRNDPQHLIASHLGGPTGPRMMVTRNGGTTWTSLAALDVMMTGNGTFRYVNQSGPTLQQAGQNISMQRNGYPQPTMVAFDPADSDIVVAAGADSGVFISTNGGARWQLVTDPNSPGASGTPHIPRPYYAYFDHDPPGGDINLFLGTRGRGAWRLTFKKVAMPEIQVPSPPDFAASCLGEITRAPVLVCNTSPGDLIVNSVTSSNPQFTITAPSGGFPITISHDFCFPVQVAFTPTAAGAASTNLVIASNDPTFPNITVAATASVGQPTAVTMIADSGNFGEFCPAPGKFKDLALTVDNRGTCPLLITGLSSSSPEFQVPQVLTFPIKVAPGDNIAVPFRFQPGSAGAKTATLTVSTNDPAAPTKSVSVTASVPPSYVCSPPVFTSIDAAAGPTWGTGRTGNYTVNTSGHFLGSFGPERRFGAQVQGEYMFYPGRQEGQLDTSLLYRRGLWQAAVGVSVKEANLRSEVFPGSLSQVTASFDALLPTIRFGAFGSKGLKETAIAGLTERVGAVAPPGGQPIIAIERVLHTVDSLGGSVQLDLVPALWWLDANAAFLNRHAPGASNTAGAAVRVSRQILPWLVGMAQFDVNESFVGPNAVGTVTVGLTIGRWPKPSDFSNPVNPLGTLVPRLHYEVFDRIR